MTRNAPRRCRCRPVSSTIGPTRLNPRTLPGAYKTELICVRPNGAPSASNSSHVKKRASSHGGRRSRRRCITPHGLARFNAPITTRPAGLVTRTSSATARSGCAANSQSVTATVTSNTRPANGSATASPRTSGAADRSAATQSIAGSRSRPVTVPPARKSASLNRPVPQPASRIFNPRAGPIALKSARSSTANAYRPQPASNHVS